MTSLSGSSVCKSISRPQFPFSALVCCTHRPIVSYKHFFDRPIIVDFSRKGTYVKIATETTSGFSGILDPLYNAAPTRAAASATIDGDETDDTSSSST
jgi:hypothetical protein